MRMILVSITLAATVASSCVPSRIDRTLNDIQTYIDERPDSALSILREIPQSALNRESTRARFSLLYAMALDKNYIDTTDISVIMPAVDYYEKHGNYNDKLNSYYYLGVIYQNTGTDEGRRKSLQALYRAENFILHASDNQAKGRLYTALANRYLRSFDPESSIEYREKSIEAYQDDHDTLRYLIAIGSQAFAYMQKGDASKADSLFEIGIRAAAGQPVLMRQYLPYDAYMKLCVEPKDPAAAINLLDTASQKYGKKLSTEDLGAYAYAYSLLGNESKADELLEMLHTLPAEEEKEYLFYEELISYHRGDYKKAYELQSKNVETERGNTRILLSYSIDGAKNEFLQKEIESQRYEAKISRLSLALVIILAILMTFAIVTSLKYKSRKKIRNLERMLAISNDSLKLTEEKATTRLWNLYLTTYKENFEMLNEMCILYLQSNGKENQKERIFKKMTKIVSFLDDEKLQKEFETKVDKQLDNSITNLKSTLPSIKDIDIRLFCLCAVGLDPIVISYTLNMTIENYYTRKSRLKNRIENSGSDHKDQLIQILS